MFRVYFSVKTRVEALRSDCSNVALARGLKGFALYLACTVAMQNLAIAIFILLLWSVALQILMQK